MILNTSVSNRGIEHILIEEMKLWLSMRTGCEYGAIDCNKNFFEYGIDSIYSAQLLNVLEGLVGYSLESHLTKDYPSINDLAFYLSNTVKEEV